MQVLYFLESLRTPFWDTVMSAVTHLGEELVFIVAALMVFWCVDKYRGYYLMAVGFAGTLLNQLLKILCRVPRPWLLDPDFTIVESARAQATGYSFPSGHTQNAVGTFGGIARFTRRKWLRWVMILLAVLVSFSRLYLGVHTPWDVGVGLVTAVILVFALYPVMEKTRRSPELLCAVIGGMVVLSAAYLLYLRTAGAPCAPTDVNYANYTAALENARKLLGATVGILLTAWLDERYIRFETDAVWWAQLLKLAMGLGLLVALKAGLKQPLASLLPAAADGVRYFLVILFAGAVWPLTFRFWGSLGRPRRRGGRYLYGTK